MPYSNSSVPWRLIPVDIPPAKHRWKKFLKRLEDNGGAQQEPSGGSSQSTEGSPTPERILKKNIMPNGAENITVVVFNKGNPAPPPVKPPDRKEKVRKVRRVSNEVQSPDAISRPSHSQDNLPSSYQRSNLTTEWHERTHDRLSERTPHSERSHSRKERRPWAEDRPDRPPRESTKRHSDPPNLPLRPWFRSHDIVEQEYGRHRPPEELPQQYRSAYAANIRISVDSNSPRKVYDDSYHGPTRHRRHSDEPKRNKTPYSRVHTPAQERLIKLEKHLKDERDKRGCSVAAEYCEKEAVRSEDPGRRKTPPGTPCVEPENNGVPLVDDEEALEGVWQVKADEVHFRGNGLKQQHPLYSSIIEKSPTANYDRYVGSCKTERKEDRSLYGPCVSPSSDSKCSTDSHKSRSDEKSTSSKESTREPYQNRSLKRKQARESGSRPKDKLKSLTDALPSCKRGRSTSPEMMDWAPVNSEVINSEIEDLRKHGLVTYSCETSSGITSGLNPNNFPMENKIFVVVDTNIMCTDVIKTLPKITLAGIDLVVYIPWQVLMELDALKLSNREIAARAQAASTLIGDRRSQSKGRLHSQPPSMHHIVVDGFKPHTPDDFILLSALQLKDKGYSVILCTNDKNLMAKSEAAGVRKFSEIDLSKVVNGKNQSRKNNAEHVALEKPPPDYVKSPESHMAHRLALALKNLLTKCLERLQEVRGNLWVLYVAILPPWSLLDVIKTARSTWDIICSSSTNSYEQLSLLNSLQFFLKETSYDNINIGKLHTLFDDCCTLATSLPTNFNKLADSFISQAREILDEHFHGSDSSQFTSKLSDIDDLEDIHDDERAANIIDQFDVFSQKLLSFCGYVYRLKNIEWPTGDLHPGENDDYSDEFIRKYTPFAVATLETIISSLSRLSSVEMGRVDSLTEGVAAIHKCLADLNGDRYKYSVKDVAAFANNSQVRANMNSGIVELRKLADILNKIV